MRRLMKGLALAGALASATLAVGCAPPATIVTAPGKVAFAADQVVVRVNELQNAAIQAEATGALDQPTTRVIVQFAVSADKVLATTPAGWQAAVKRLWDEAAPKIHTTNPTVQFAITALSGLLGAL